MSREKVAMTVPNLAGAAAGTDQNTGTEPDPQDQPPAPGAPAASGANANGEDDLGEKGKAALDKERTARRDAEKRAKEGEAAIAKLAELEEAQKSEQQKLTERAEKAEREAADAKASILRRDVAADKKLPAAMAERLRGTTREELEADADALLALMPAPASNDADKGGRGTPPPSGTSGQAPATSMNEAVVRHYAGRSH